MRTAVLNSLHMIGEGYSIDAQRNSVAEWPVVGFERISYAYAYLACTLYPIDDTAKQNRKSL